SVEGGRIAERGEHAEDAVPADHGDLDMFALCEIDDQRDDAAVRQISALERFAGADEDAVLNEVNSSQLRPYQLEIIGAQRRQKSVRWTRGRIQSPSPDLTGKTACQRAMHANERTGWSWSNALARRNKSLPMRSKVAARICQLGADLRIGARCFR